MPVAGGGCLILYLHVSTPVFFNSTVYVYVFPSFNTPKSTSSGNKIKPLIAWSWAWPFTVAPAIRELLVLRRTGSSTWIYCRHKILISICIQVVEYIETVPEAFLQMLFFYVIKLTQFYVRFVWYFKWFSFGSNIKSNKLNIMCT